MQRRDFGTQRAHRVLDETSKSSKIAIAAVVMFAGGGISYASSSSISKPSPTPVQRSESNPEQVRAVDDLQRSVKPNLHTSGPQPDKTSESSQSSSTSTSTVTVNGSTTTLEGDGSINKSYTSNDGTTDVSISIEHSSNTSSDSGGNMN